MNLNIPLIKKIFYLIFISLIIYIFFKLFIFYIPFAVAYIISKLLNPIIIKVSKKFNFSRKISSIIVLTAFFLITGAVLFLVTNKIVEESNFFLSMINTYIEKVNDFISKIENENKIFGNYFISDNMKNIIIRNINDYFNNLGEYIKSIITNLVMALKSIPVYFMNIIITILAIYFISSDRFSILDKLEFQFTRKFISKIRVKLDKIFDTLFNYLKAEIILICISFIIVLLGLYIFKLIGMNIKYPFLMALLIGLVDALPILGAGTVMVPWSIILFVEKDTSLGFLILGLFILILCTKQILEPKIVSNKIGVHPIFTLISMYTGFKVKGLIGIILGPIILIVLKEIFENLLDKGLVNYLNE